MKVVPAASPQAVQQVTTNNTSSRDKAILAYMGQQAQTAAPTTGNAQASPVTNPNAVSPEELSAIKPQEQLSQIAEQATQAAETMDNSTIVEAPKAEVPAKEEIDPETARRYAHLARQEKILRAKAQKQDETFKQREADLKVKEDAIKTLEQQYRTGYISKDQLKTNALSVLADAGVSYDELTQQILSQTPQDPRLIAKIDAMERHNKALEEKLTKLETSRDEEKTTNYKQAVNQIRMDIKKLVSADPMFETIKTTGSTEDVVELIERTFKEEGRIMDVEEAAQEVENYLMEKLEKIYSNTDKIKKRLAKANQPKTESKPMQTQAATQQQTQQPTMKTLTNAVASTRKLSSRERALLAFKGELKE